MRYSCPAGRAFHSECPCPHIRGDRPSLEADGGSELYSREETPIGSSPKYSMRALRASLKRMAFDAGSEVGRFFPVVCIGSDLAARCSLFKCDSMLLDEGNEFVAEAWI
jgi:hypothetical protein